LGRRLGALHYSDWRETPHVVSYVGAVPVGGPLAPWAILREVPSRSGEKRERTRALHDARALHPAWLPFSVRNLRGWVIRETSPAAVVLPSLRTRHLFRIGGSAAMRGSFWFTVVFWFPRDSGITPFQRHRCRVQCTEMKQPWSSLQVGSDSRRIRGPIPAGVGLRTGRPGQASAIGFHGFGILGEALGPTDAG